MISKKKDTYHSYRLCRVDWLQVRHAFNQRQETNSHDNASQEIAMTGKAKLRSGLKCMFEGRKVDCRFTGYSQHAGCILWPGSIVSKRRLRCSTGQGPSFEQTWIPSTQGCFLPSLLEIDPVVLKNKDEHV